jgi:hypothetical protein
MDSGGLVIPHPIHMPQRSPVQQDTKLNIENDYLRTVTHREGWPNLREVIPNFFRLGGERIEIENNVK